MSVRAKFRVESITKTHDQGITVKMLAVHDPKIPEEMRFAMLTPTASIVMFITTHSAEEFFELGEAYYVDFSAISERDARRSRATDR
jgi:hypothetical protein